MKAVTTRRAEVVKGSVRGDEARKGTGRDGWKGNARTHAKIRKLGGRERNSAPGGEKLRIKEPTVVIGRWWWWEWMAVGRGRKEREMEEEKRRREVKRREEGEGNLSAPGSGREMQLEGKRGTLRLLMDARVRAAGALRVCCGGCSQRCPITGFTGCLGANALRLDFLLGLVSGHCPKEGGGAPMALGMAGRLLGPHPIARVPALRFSPGPWSRAPLE